jgi:hypothetical protein
MLKHVSSKKIHSKPPKTIDELFERPLDVEVFQKIVETRFGFLNFVPCFLIIQEYFFSTEKESEELLKTIEKDFLPKIEIENKINKDSSLEEKENFLKSISEEILSVLRFLFTKIKTTEEWKLYISSNYTTDLKPLFEEEFEVLKQRKKTKINEIEFLKVRNFETKHYYFARKYLDTNENISKIKHQHNTIHELFQLCKHSNVLHLLNTFESELNDKEKELFCITKEVSMDLASWMNYNDVSTISQHVLLLLEVNS